MAGKEEEVRAIEEAHRAAQARLGIAGAYLAMAEWGSVNSLNASASGASWVQRSLRMINAIRRKSSKLAVAYIRLVRALETGYTLGYPEWDDNPDKLSMGDLREQFRDLLLQIADMDREATETDDADEQWFESELRRAEEDPEPRQDRITFADTEIDEQIQEWLDSADDNDSSRVTVEDFNWGTDMDPDEIRDAFQAVLGADVVEEFLNRSKSAWRDEDLTGRQAQAKVDRAFSTAGSTGGGRVDRYGISAGREIVDHVVAKDRRVKAYGRGTRANCCAFCALMAARGFVYKNESQAKGTYKRTTRAGNVAANELFDENGMRKYHDNCHCFVIVRYIDNPELPKQSAEWADAYETKIAPNNRYSDGRNNALNAWRTWLNHDRLAKEGTAPRKRGRPKKTT